MRLAHQAWQEGLVDLVQQYLQNQVPKRSEDPDRRASNGTIWIGSAGRTSAPCADIPI